MTSEGLHSADLVVVELSLTALELVLVCLCVNEPSSVMSCFRPAQVNDLHVWV